MKDKNQLKIKSKLRLGLSIIGFTTITYLSHKFASEKYPDATRKFYFDKLFNYNYENTGSSKYVRTILIFRICITC
jgi:hypothetical protein